MTEEDEQIILPGAERESEEQVAARKRQQQKVEAEARMQSRMERPTEHEAPEDLPLFGGPRQNDFEFAAASDRRAHGIPREANVPVASYKTDTDIKAHPDYRAAKSGDPAAAVRLVQAVVKPETVAEAESRFGSDVIYVPVTAREASGDNAIPGTLARYYAEATGAETETGIVQINHAFHTGARPMDRLISRPRFAGAVKPKQKYVLVDDVTVLGGTLAELANHIQQNGGEVVGIVTLVNASRTGHYTANPRHLRLIEQRFGNEVRQHLGVEPQALTADEARYLLGFRDAEGFRAAVSKAEGQRDRRLREKGLLPPSEEEDRSLRGATPGAAVGPDLKSHILAIARRINPNVRVEFVDRLIATGPGAEASGIQSVASPAAPIRRFSTSS